MRAGASLRMASTTSSVALKVGPVTTSRSLPGSSLRPHAHDCAGSGQFAASCARMAPTSTGRSFSTLAFFSFVAAPLPSTAKSWSTICERARRHAGWRSSAPELEVLEAARSSSKRRSKPFRASMSK